MKITFVLPETGSVAVGGIRVIYEYANHLMEKGHEANIVYPFVPYIPRPRFTFKNFHEQIDWLKSENSKLIINLKKRKRIDWFNLKANIVLIPATSPRYSWLSKRFIPDADVVLATSWETAYLVSKLSKKKGIKCYFVQQYEIWDVWNSFDLWKKAEEIEPDQTKLCLAMHDIIPDDEKLRDGKKLVDDTYKLPLNKIVISSWLKDLIEQKFNQKAMGPIINGVNFNIYHQEKIQKTGRRILMPWRPQPWKGTEDGLKAFSIVRERYPECEFTIFGVPSDQRVPEWVKTYGRISDDELRRLYNSSDIFVVPSWVEGSQLPPMEAMACGCAVVATNVGGILDYAIPGETCLVSPPRNPEALASNIIELLNDPKSSKRYQKLDMIL